MASGLSCAVGFKNATNGGVKVALDAIGAAEAPHNFLSVTKFGHSAIVSTKGNEDCHIILRGGDKGPNYSAEDVEKVCADIEKQGVFHTLWLILAMQTAVNNIKSKWMFAKTYVIRLHLVLNKSLA